MSPEQTASKERKESLDSDLVLPGRKAILVKTVSQELKARKVTPDPRDLLDPRGQEGKPGIRELME